MQGQFEDAEVCFCELVNDSELEAGQILRDTGWRNLGMVIAWIRPLEADAVLDRALDVNQAASVRVGVAQTYVSRAISQVGRESTVGVQGLLNRGETLLHDTGGDADLWMVLFARLFLTAVDGTTDEVLAAARALSRHVNDSGCHPGLIEVAARWVTVRGLEPIEECRGSGEYWIDRKRTLNSWERILRERQEIRFSQRTAE